MSAAQGWLRPGRGRPSARRGSEPLSPVDCVLVTGRGCPGTSPAHGEWQPPRPESLGCSGARPSGAAADLESHSVCDPEPWLPLTSCPDLSDVPCAEGAAVPSRRTRSSLDN